LYLGRPWRANAKTVFIRCNLPKAIAPEGWNNWNNPENEKTVFYAEYKSTGDGAAPDKRVKWSKQLSDKEAQRYSPSSAFSFAVKMDGVSGYWFSEEAAKPFDYAAFKTRKPEIVNLYKTVPNNKPVTDKENAVTRDNVTRISKISNPTLTVFRAQRPNGKAVIICPGGGYSILAFDKEGNKSSGRI
jgi:hypothetical protein